MNSSSLGHSVGSDWSTKIPHTLAATNFTTKGGLNFGIEVKCVCMWKCGFVFIPVSLEGACQWEWPIAKRHIISKWICRLAQDLVERLVLGQRTANSLFKTSCKKEAWQWEWPVSKTHMTSKQIHITLPNFVETYTHTHTFLGHDLPRPYTLAPPQSITLFIIDSCGRHKCRQNFLFLHFFHKFRIKQYTLIYSTQYLTPYFSEYDVLIFSKEKWNTKISLWCLYNFMISYDAAKMTVTFFSCWSQLFQICACFHNNHM